MNVFKKGDICSICAESSKENNRNIEFLRTKRAKFFGEMNYVRKACA